MRPSLPLTLPLRKIVSPRTAVRTPIPDSRRPDVSIIVPARNEEANLSACLESLTTQTGVTFEIIVVDDDSTDRTCEIALSFTGVQVIFPKALPKDSTPKTCTGKNNALIAGAKDAQAQWLLFTDADTVHRPGSLACALEEAKRERADLLSYSPKQVVVTFAERAVMPVVFSELARQYPPHKVREPNSKVVAANGQYILVRREAYNAVGGHAAVGSEILEDVALARRFREAGKRVYFRYGGDAVRTRMYRNWSQLCEGWTKNLALLFPRTGLLAMQSLVLWGVAWSSVGIAASGVKGAHFFRVGFVFFWLLVYRRVKAANFSPLNNLMAMAFGLPMFAYLLMRSVKAHASGVVSWKGRGYDVGPRYEGASKAIQPKTMIPSCENQKLRTES